MDRAQDKCDAVPLHDLTKLGLFTSALTPLLDNATFPDRRCFQRSGVGFDSMGGQCPSYPLTLPLSSTSLVCPPKSPIQRVNWQLCS